MSVGNFFETRPCQIVSVSFEANVLIMMFSEMMLPGVCQYFFISDVNHFRNVLKFNLTTCVNLLSNAGKTITTACRPDIEQDDLGGGNWSGGQLFEAGRQVARVAYNGRVWEMENCCLYSPLTAIY